ncbi:S41 family peptidase [Actinoplanes sp. NPDC048988]|uniref:S41 family peptidase n=1 Tax=Actinoplanes sp. NPDC048988 TaxID=3363901 RepID=UPI00371C051A
MPQQHLGALAAHLSHWLRRLMPPGPRLDTLTAGLESGFTGRRDPVTAETCRELETFCQRTARHLELHFDPDGAAPPDEQPPGWPAPDPAAIRRRGAGVTAVQRQDDGTCVLRIDSLEPVSVALPYLEAAFALARDATSVVLDLRANGGGDPGTVAAIAGRLLGETTRPLSEVVYRDRRRQWWPRVTEAHLTQDVTVLVSGRTYSSAEALAYHLQARDRVTVIGERTPGTADHVTPVRLTPQVLGLLPEATVIDAVTGTNWEQTGVGPRS